MATPVLLLWALLAFPFHTPLPLTRVWFPRLYTCSHLLLASLVGYVSNLPHFAPAPICFLLLWVVTCLIYHTLHLLPFASCFFAWLITSIFSVLLHLSRYKRGLPSLSVLFSCILSYMHVSLLFFSVHGTFVVLFFNGSFAVVFSFINV